MLCVSFVALLQVVHRSLTPHVDTHELPGGGRGLRARDRVGERRSQLNALKLLIWYCSWDLVMRPRNASGGVFLDSRSEPWLCEMGDVALNLPVTCVRGDITLNLPVTTPSSSQTGPRRRHDVEQHQAGRTHVRDDVAPASARAHRRAHICTYTCTCERAPHTHTPSNLLQHIPPCSCSSIDTYH